MAQRRRQLCSHRRTERSSDSYLKRTSARFFYRFHNRLSPIKIPENVGDFRLMNRAAVDALKQLPERNRFMKGLFAWIGFNPSPSITPETALRGREQILRLEALEFALEGFTSFSTAPLKLWTYVGGIGAIGSAIYAAIIILRTLIRGVDIPGYASLLVVVLFIGSIQLIGIGVLGEYIGRIYIESKQRPGYIVRKSYGHAGRRVTELRSLTGSALRSLSRRPFCTTAGCSTRGRSSLPTIGSGSTTLNSCRGGSTSRSFRSSSTTTARLVARSSRRFTRSLG
jgi:hypothetical protein